MSQAVTTTQAKPVEAKRDIRSFIQSEAVLKQLQMALPKHITADRMARVVVTAIMRTPKLAQCTQASLLNCMMQCSQFGLEPDGRRAHLIPFENRKTGEVECTLILDWRGLAELALRSGLIAKLHADVVCEKDDFEFDLGDVLHHKINFKQARGEPYCAYALAVTKTGEKFVQVMTKAEIEAIRDNSQGWKAFQKGWASQSPWKDYPGEMWKKTVFRRLSKWLPLSPEYRDAVEVDDEPIQATVSEATAALPAMPSFALPEPHAIEATAAVMTDEPKPQAQPTVIQEQEAKPKAKKPEKPVEQKPPAELLATALKDKGLEVEKCLAFYNNPAFGLRGDSPEAKSLSDIPEQAALAIRKNIVETPNEAVIAAITG